jgi:hypothetical protein
MTQKYKVQYLRPKKKKGFFVEEEVTFFDIESAVFYEAEMSKRGSKDFKIIPA